MAPTGSTGYQFSDNQDVFLLRIVMKVKGHVASPGAKYQLFNRIHKIYCDSLLSKPIKSDRKPTARILFWRFVILLRWYAQQDSSHPDNSTRSNIQRQKFSLLDSIATDRRQDAIDKQNPIRDPALNLPKPTLPLPPPPPATIQPVAADHHDRHPCIDQHDTNKLQNEQSQDDGHSRATRHQRARKTQPPTRQRVFKRFRSGDDDGRAPSSIRRRTEGASANTRAARNPRRATPARSTATAPHHTPASTPRRSAAATPAATQAANNRQYRRASFPAMIAAVSAPAMSPALRGRDFRPLQPVRGRLRSRSRSHLTRLATRSHVAERQTLPTSRLMPSDRAQLPLSNREHVSDRTAERAHARSSLSDLWTRNEATPPMPTEGAAEIGDASNPLTENLNSIPQAGTSGHGPADQLIDLIKSCIEMEKQRQIMEDRERERMAKHREALNHLLIHLAEHV